jgi:hypothetical protein
VVFYLAELISNCCKEQAPGHLQWYHLRQWNILLWPVAVVVAVAPVKQAILVAAAVAPAD